MKQGAGFPRANSEYRAVCICAPCQLQPSPSLLFTVCVWKAERGDVSLKMPVLSLEGCKLVGRAVF